MVVPPILTRAYLADRWPVLYHMAEAGSWPMIQRHGLLSTQALLDLFGVTGGQRDQIEAVKRDETIRIDHPALGTAWVRDNKPINETVLRRTLEGISEADWYRSLNSRVFFWLTEDRLTRLRNAPPYRGRQHDILRLSTPRVLDRYGEDVELSPLNSGAVHPAANYARGVGTFRTINEYPWVERCRIAPQEPIVELTVPYAVANVEELVLDVQTF